MILSAAASPSQTHDHWYTSSVTVALLGVIVGALVKWAVDSLTERSRRRRENQLRFIERKTDVYVETINVLRRLSDACELASTLNLSPDADSMEARETLEKFDQLEVRLQELTGRLYLLAGNPVIDAIIDGTPTKPLDQTDASAWARASDGWLELMSDFVNASRVDLGVDP